MRFRQNRVAIQIQFRYLFLERVPAGSSTQRTFLREGRSRVRHWALICLADAHDVRLRLIINESRGYFRALELKTPRHLVDDRMQHSFVDYKLVNTL